MIKGFKIALVLILFTNCVFGQEDSIQLQIMGYDDSRSAIIAKGRSLLLDKFLAGDLNKVREVKDYLVKTEDADYFAFYPAEYWLILYWTNEYTELAYDIQHFDSAVLASFNTRISPPRDKLLMKLNERSFEYEFLLKGQIKDADLDEETKQMLLMNLDNILLENRKDMYAQDSLNSRADEFLKRYSPGIYDDFTKKYIRYKMVPKNWGMTFEFFSGLGIFNGNLGKTYTNNIPIGVAFDICYKNFELYHRDYIGFNKTRVDLYYSTGTWEKDSRLEVFLPEASVGYVGYNDNRLKVSPFAGIGAMSIGPSPKELEDNPDLEELELDFTTAYIVGLNLDIKFGPYKTPAHSPKTSYGFMRIRYGLSMPRFENKYTGMTGNMHYITVGFGGMSRGVRREY